MKIQNVRDVKMRLNRIIKELPKTGSVVITKNGRPCAALLPVTEETDLEALALTHNERFWRMFDAAIARGEKEGWSDLEELSDLSPPPRTRGSCASTT
jgi:prevent-host-death family protein